MSIFKKSFCRISVLCAGVIVGVVMSASVNGATLSDQEFCDQVYMTAAVAQEYRQNGVTLPQMIQKVKDAKGEGTNVEKYARKAYTVPLYDTEKFKKKAIDKYAEQAYNDCSEQYNL